MSNLKKNQVDIKRKIIESSIKLFADKGYDGTSIRDIADAVKTSLPTIYYHFGSKEGLYKSIFDEIIEQFLVAIANSTTGVKGIRERLIAMGMGKHQFTAKNREMMLLYLRELYSPKGIDILKDVFEKGIKMIESLIREGIKTEELRQVDPNLAAWYLMGVFSIFDVQIVSSEKLPSKEDITKVVDLALQGITKI